MFGKILLITVLALIAWAVVARASYGAGSEVRYTVKRGDTLWAIDGSRQRAFVAALNQHLAT